MAMVYFVRDGSGDSTTDSGHEVSLAAIAVEFGNIDLKFWEHPPKFNSGSPANVYSDFRYVVIQVNGGETAGKFSKSGYWHLHGVSPAEFDRKIPVS